jgi:hypothetical protein
MWLTLSLVVLALAVVGYVWFRQRRHPVPPGRRPGHDAQIQEKGSFWGGGGVG